MKNLDVFKVDVGEALNFTRHNYRTDKTRHSLELGSYCGGFTSVIGFVAVVVYLSILVTQMESGELD